MHQLIQKCALVFQTFQSLYKSPSLDKSWKYITDQAPKSNILRLSTVSLYGMLKHTIFRCLGHVILRALSVGTTRSIFLFIFHCWCMVSKASQITIAVWNPTTFVNAVASFVSLSGRCTIKLSIVTGLMSIRKPMSCMLLSYREQTCMGTTL